MSVPWRWPDAMRSAAAAALACAAAAAQPLQLDRPQPPKPGEGRILTIMARDLRDNAAVRRVMTEPLRGRDRVAADLSIAARTLAHALLAKAEALGEPGSPHALAGLTIAGRMAEFDQLADRLREGELSPEAEAAAAVFVAQVAAQHENVPDDVAALDRWLRDLLAVPVHVGLVPEAEPVWESEGWRVGWGAPGGAVPDLSAAAERWAAAAPDAAEAAARFDVEIVRPARAWWAYRGSADVVAGAIIAAGRVAEEGGLPEWVPADVKAELVARFSAAAAGAIDPAQREEAMRTLADLTIGSALMSKLDRVASASGLGPSVRQRVVAAAREGLLVTVLAGEEGRSELVALDTALRLLGERAELGGDEDVVRDARPAWRALEGAAKSAEGRLWEVLGRVRPGAAGDPAVLAAIAAARRAVDDLRAVRGISAWLASDAGLEPGMRNLVGQRVLRLGQEMAGPEGRGSGRDAAVEQLRRLGAGVALLLSFPGEDGLRGGESPWRELTGGRAAEVAARIDQGRRAWVEAWARGGDVEAAAGELERLRRLVGAMHDLELLRSACSGAGSAGGWAGWEMSERAGAALERGASPVVARACGLELSGDAAGAEAALREYENGWAAVRLAAEVERRAREWKMARAPVVVELGAAPPPGGVGWLAAARADAAAVCRYAEEYAGGNVRVLRYLNERARAGLAAIKGR